MERILKNLRAEHQAKMAPKDPTEDTNLLKGKDEVHWMTVIADNASSPNQLGVELLKEFAAVLHNLNLVRKTSNQCFQDAKIHFNILGPGFDTTFVLRENREAELAILRGLEKRVTYDLAHLAAIKQNYVCKDVLDMFMALLLTYQIPGLMTNSAFTSIPFYNGALHTNVLLLLAPNPENIMKSLNEVKNSVDADIKNLQEILDNIHILGAIIVSCTGFASNVFTFGTDQSDPCHTMEVPTPLMTGLQQPQLPSIDTQSAVSSSHTAGLADLANLTPGGVAGSEIGLNVPAQSAPMGRRSSGDVQALADMYLQIMGDQASAADSSEMVALGQQPPSGLGLGSAGDQVQMMLAPPTITNQAGTPDSSSSGYPQDLAWINEVNTASSNDLIQTPQLTTHQTAAIHHSGAATRSSAAGMGLYVDRITPSDDGTPNPTAVTPSTPQNDAAGEPEEWTWGGR